MVEGELPRRALLRGAAAAGLLPLVSRAAPAPVLLPPTRQAAPPPDPDRAVAAAIEAALAARGLAGTRWELRTVEDLGRFLLLDSSGRTLYPLRPLTSEQSRLL